MDRQNETLVAAFAVALSGGRGKAQLTQKELAERSDVSPRFISLLETGRRQPSFSTLHALSKGLRIRMQDLIAAVERHHDADSVGPKNSSGLRWVVSNGRGRKSCDRGRKDNGGFRRGAIAPPEYFPIVLDGNV